MKKREGLHISGAISQFLKDIGFRKRRSLARIREAWIEAAGEDQATHTRLAGFDRGVLIVEVDSAGRLQEFANFYKSELLFKLRADCKRGCIVDIKFRLGDWEKADNA